MASEPFAAAGPLTATVYSGSMAVNQHSPSMPCFIDTVGRGCGSDSGDDSHGTCSPWPSPRQRRPYRSQCRHDSDGESAFCPGLVSIHQRLHLRRNCFQQSPARLTRFHCHPCPQGPQSQQQGRKTREMAPAPKCCDHRRQRSQEDQDDWEMDNGRMQRIRDQVHNAPRSRLIGGCADVNRYGRIG